MAVKVAEVGGRRIILSCRVEPEAADGQLGGNIWYGFENPRVALARGIVKEQAGEARGWQDLQRKE